MPGDNDLAEALAFRVGRKVPRNIYRGDEPVCMVATAEAAEELVTLLNLGAAALRVRPEARAGDGTGERPRSILRQLSDEEIQSRAAALADAKQRERDERERWVQSFSDPVPTAQPNTEGRDA